MQPVTKDKELIRRILIVSGSYVAVNILLWIPAVWISFAIWGIESSGSGENVGLIILNLVYYLLLYGFFRFSKLIPKPATVALIATATGLISSLVVARIIPLLSFLLLFRGTIFMSLIFGALAVAAAYYFYESNRLKNPK